SYIPTYSELVCRTGSGKEDGWNEVNNNGNETVTYYHQDHLLSTRFLTDQNGNKVEEEEYEEFGSDINNVSEKYKYTQKEIEMRSLISITKIFLNASHICGVITYEGMIL
ncbi:MAG: hypothetical protein J7J21_05755, partial [Methanomicrobia archaeon]|nr:hypothetical protein [Methanomicrobia archaeon]